MFNIFILLMEVLFCYLFLAKFNIYGIKNKIKLFFIVLFVLISGDILLSSSIFKHLYYIVGFLIGLKILNRDIRLSHSITITLIIFFKYIIEFLTVFILFNKIDFCFIIIIFESLSVLFSIIISKYINKINNKLIKLWNSYNCFYFRYLFLIVLNSFVLFILYNLKIF